MPPKHCKYNSGWRGELLGSSSNKSGIILPHEATTCNTYYFSSKSGDIHEPSYKFLTSLHSCTCPHLPIHSAPAKTNHFSVCSGPYTIYRAHKTLFLSKIFIKNESHDTICIFKNYFTIIYFSNRL